ncbi:MAG: 1,2-dihydroxy-3-keto-5-methylthiopentene dioxygenase [Pseudomonadota bacterium]
MAALKIYSEQKPDTPLVNITDKPEMARHLRVAGVRYEQWAASAPIKAGDSQEQVIAAYRSDIDRLIADQGYQAVDVVSLNKDNPNKAELRKKFLDEHRHMEDEVRFFVDGAGLFTLHIGDKVYEVLCTKGDLISVPAGTPHWFDMGPNPHFVAIRLFNNPEGWVAHFTGSDIAQKFSRLDN